jgi:hypothetical protein
MGSSSSAINKAHSSHPPHATYIHFHPMGEDFKHNNLEIKTEGSSLLNNDALRHQENVA